MGLKLVEPLFQLILNEIVSLFSRIRRFFHKKKSNEATCLLQNNHDQSTEMIRYLIVGLGNFGPDYVGTRHNAGFMVVDMIAESKDASWESCRYGDMTTVRVKNRELVLLKPSTFMNLSGVAVRYWMNKFKLPLDRLLVIVDDLALPFGAIRLRGGGSDAGHNGLKNIAEQLGTNSYARLRFGIGNDFPKGSQVDFVLGQFSSEERKELPSRLETAAEAVKTYCLSGLSTAMNQFNNK